ncbi:MAG: multidrug effflux MFS transporter [Betaproteobacteria bacterium]|nr:multidrug effflux MFS transporter [Betaproteobacteria bacterium]
MRLPLKHPGVIAMIVAGFASFGLSTDMTVASLPGMVRYFGVSVSQAQLTLSAFVLAFALSQLVYGPLSDRYGRRATMLAGNVIYLLATIACIAAPSIEVLIAARFFQAIGGCAWAVVGRAIVRDIHGHEGTARMMGIIGVGQSLLIVLGPIIAGQLEQSFGWRANFAFLLAFGALLTLAAALLLAESHPHRDARDTDIGQTLRNYAILLANRRVWGCTLCNAFAFAAILAFHSGASFVLMGLLGVSAPAFGLLFSLTILGYMGGSFVTVRWVAKTGADRLLSLGTALGMAAGTAMAALALAGVQSVAAIIAPYFVFLVSVGFTQPAAIAGAIGPFARIAGTASALFGFVQLTFGALSGYVVGRLYDGTPIPMAVGIGVGTWGAFLSFQVLVRRPPTEGK